MECVLQLWGNNCNQTDRATDRLCFSCCNLLSTSYNINLYFSLHIFFYPISINLGFFFQFLSLISIVTLDFLIVIGFSHFVHFYIVFVFRPDLLAVISCAR